MSQMYIANPSQQYVDFIYRLPESTNNITQKIPPGGQIRIAARRGNLTPPDIDAILEQHAKYGLIRASDISKRRGYVGLIAEIDKPVNMKQIVDGIKGNREILIERGKEIRKNSAVALNEQIQATIDNQSMPEALRGLEFSVEELKSASVRDTGRGEDSEISRELASTGMIGEGVKVSRDAPLERPAPVRRARRPRSR